MKTIPVEQLDARVSEALEAQHGDPAIRLTKNTHTVGWIVRLPEGMKDTEPDLVLYKTDSAGGILIVLESKSLAGEPSDESTAAPIFGAGRGTLSVVSEDDDHLKDFAEYME